LTNSTYLQTSKY